jgi:hypothetical protein
MPLALSISLAICGMTKLKLLYSHVEQFLGTSFLRANQRQSRQGSSSNIGRRLLRAC